MSEIVDKLKKAGYVTSTDPSDAIEEALDIQGGGGDSVLNPVFGVIEPDFYYRADSEHYDGDFGGYDNVGPDTIIESKDIKFHVPAGEGEWVDDKYYGLFKREKLEERIYNETSEEVKGHRWGMLDFADGSLFIEYIISNSYDKSQTGPYIVGNSNDYRFVTYDIDDDEYLMIDDNSY